MLDKSKDPGLGIRFEVGSIVYLRLIPDFQAGGSQLMRADGDDCALHFLDD